MECAEHLLSFRVMTAGAVPALALSAKDYARQLILLKVRMANI